jgi:TRAP-type C4-dicarboxylate transport system substrate-binding protein
MAYSEYFTSVENGTVDGTLSPLVTIFTDKTYKTAPYITRANQFYCPATLLMNVEVWNSMDPELQEIILTAAKEARDFERTELAKLEADYTQQMIDDGATVFEADQNIWQNQQTAIDASWSSIVPSQIPQELIDEIKALAD